MSGGLTLGAALLLGLIASGHRRVPPTASPTALQLDLDASLQTIRDIGYRFEPNSDHEMDD